MRDDIYQVKDSIHHLFVADLLDLEEANEDTEFETILDVHLDNLLRLLDLGQCDLLRFLGSLLGLLHLASIQPRSNNSDKLTFHDFH